MDLLCDSCVVFEVELSPAALETYIASAAEEVYVTPAAAPLLTGLRASSVFLGLILLYSREAIPEFV